MKKLSIQKLMAFAICLAFISYSHAQKIAHISLDSLVTVMPETNIAKEVAQNYLKSLDQEMLTMQSEFESKYKDFLEKEATMSETIKQNKQQDLQQLNKRIEDFRNQASQDYQRKYGELTAPIMDKAKKGIEAVAKEAGYKYVFDTSVGNVLYFEPSDDIFNAVKKKLDSMPQAAIPGANNTTKEPKSPVKSSPPAKTGGK
ncbi:MAG: OmpH family outer membrane protein [Sphingobacteriaceae bacterium]|nr:OmpH family outer membrane protein [Sphingobacteriaceae bacterium]